MRDAPLPRLTPDADGRDPFRLLVESVRDYAIFMLDPTGRIASWNLGAERTKGYAADEIVGQHFSRFYPEEDRAAGKPARALKVAAAEGRYEEEGWRVRKDGSRFWASVVITALRDRGELVGFAKVTRDMTERHELLERERNAREAAEAALRLRDEFISIAAHELKTPITVLRGFAQVVLRRFDKEGGIDAAVVQQAMRSVNQHSQKLGRLVEQLLDVSRIELGRLRLDPEPVDVVKVTARLLEARRAAGEPRELAFEAPPALEVEADPLRLEQVLTNLLDNAAKYSPAGDRIAVRVEASQGGGARLTVADRGVGVDPAHRPYIFDRYYQAHASDHLSGMGVGLYVSREIVRLHGGELRAEFPPEGGSRFVVELPARPPAQAAG